MFSVRQCTPRQVSLLHVSFRIYFYSIYVDEKRHQYPSTKSYNKFTKDLGEISRVEHRLSLTFQPLFTFRIRIDQRVSSLSCD